MQTTKQLLKLANQGEIESKFELGYKLAFGKKTFKNPPWKTNTGNLLLKADI
jgi:hypothetical protein